MRVALGVGRGVVEGVPKVAVSDGAGEGLGVAGYGVCVGEGVKVAVGGEVKIGEGMGAGDRLGVAAGLHATRLRASSRRENARRRRWGRVMMMLWIFYRVHAKDVR